ncbi:zinc-binding dehydrogenase [Paenibacillus koleovorans]|uniref:zinc-binding dehydrogenase n=1 Tax=Paenibacillus koleovorans TaxID=121608 RepID=UPI000FD90C99|nr:alcohol dehydrogenase catalytic domain-containing protein [Paenibacillus koleovorans]
MKALIYEGPKQMNLREADIPVPAEDEVLIKVRYSGICGSELSGYLGHNSLRKPPLIFGHEFSGTIVQLGDRVAVEFPALLEGARVTANPLITCGKCPDCLRGKQQICAHRQLISAALPGSNAEYVKLPARSVVPLDDRLTFEQGAFIEPLACGVRVAEVAEVKPGQRVLIVGMGPIGLFSLQAIQAFGVKEIYVTDRNLSRLEMAAELGAIPLNPNEVNVKEEILRATGGAGVEVAVDAVGAGATRLLAIDCARNGGKVIFTGLHEADSELPVNQMIRKEISCSGAFAYSAANFQTAAQWMANGWIRMDEDWVVKAPFQTAQVWYEKLLSDPGKVAKVLLHP